MPSCKQVFFKQEVGQDIVRPDQVPTTAFCIPFTIINYYYAILFGVFGEMHSNSQSITKHGYI
jgi:hypothetical protein